MFLKTIVQRFRKIHPISIASILLFNIIPIIGVCFYHWHASELIFLFWMETFMIGVFHIFKMIVLSLWERTMGLLLFFVPFFCIHYGAFVFASLFVLFGLTLQIDLPRLWSYFITSFNWFLVILIIQYIIYGVQYIYHEDYKDPTRKLIEKISKESKTRKEFLQTPVTGFMGPKSVAETFGDPYPRIFVIFGVGILLPTFLLHNGLKPNQNLELFFLILPKAISDLYFWGRATWFKKTDKNESEHKI